MVVWRHERRGAHVLLHLLLLLLLLLLLPRPDGTSLRLFCLLLLLPLSERLRRLKQLDHQLGVELIRDLLLEVGLFVRCPSEPI